MATPNTVLADINEIWCGYCLNNKKWFDGDAKTQYNSRVAQATPDEVADAQGKAEVMADEFKVWAKKHGYRAPIKGVWWTARPGSMSAAVGESVDQRKNPTDILVKFNSGPKGTRGFLGLSAKATKGKTDIGFKNPGVGTVDTSLGLKFTDKYKSKLDETVSKLALPEKAAVRKKYIRENTGVKKLTEQIGVDMMKAFRNEMLTKLKRKTQPQLLDYLLNYWMDADILFPPYVKVTGMGNKSPYTAEVQDPLDNDKLVALRDNRITLESVGNESIGVKAGIKQILKMRFKFESEKMASSLKMSGDPW